MAEDKREFVMKLGELLKTTDDMSNLRTLLYRESKYGEQVYALFDDGTQKRADVTCSSCLMMIDDVKECIKNGKFLSESEMRPVSEFIAQDFAKYASDKTVTDSFFLFVESGQPGMLTNLDRTNDLFYDTLMDLYDAEDFSKNFGALFSSESDYDDAMSRANRFLEDLAGIAQRSVNAIMVFKDEKDVRSLLTRHRDEAFYDKLKKAYSVIDFLATTGLGDRELGNIYNKATQYIAEKDHKTEGTDMGNEWQNYGDVNFYEHGGIMVRKDTELSDSYNFFYLEHDDQGNKYAFYGTVMDLKDYIGKGYLEELLNAFNDRPEPGLLYENVSEMIEKNPGACVVELVRNYGCGVFEFSPKNCRWTGEYSMDMNEFKLNDQELVEFMSEVDIPAEYIPDLEYEAVSRYGEAGIEDSLKSNDWEEIKDFAHEKLMSGHPVEVTDHENGSSVKLDPGEYAEKFNGEFPVDPRYSLETDYGDEIERE